MEIRAHISNVPLSAQKGRLVVDLVRSLKVSKAVDILKFTNKKGSEIILKLVQSAIANAENNHGSDIDDLVVAKIYVNEAASLKRIQARAKGRANRITKRRCHITVILAEEEL
jgi:large subunit ribosomal protein L22